MFFKQVGDSVVFSGDGYLQMYIPERYFTSKCTIINGEYILTLGLFNYSVHDKSGKMLGKPKLFNLPSVFLTKPSTIESVKNFDVDGIKDDYRILKYIDRDSIIVHVNVPQDVENVVTFFKLFVITGKPPKTIPYKDTYKPFIESMELNGESFGINNQLFGIMISELYRDPTDTSKPFRLSKAKKNKEWMNYDNISVKEIPSYISAYTNITAESFDDSLIQAIMMDPNRNKDTPMERIFTGE